jgi:CII-binding regulator of phage lambda lysogenization HflD
LKFADAVTQCLGWTTVRLNQTQVHDRVRQTLLHLLRVSARADASRCPDGSDTSAPVSGRSSCKAFVCCCNTVTRVREASILAVHGEREIGDGRG